jgi:hypothetical protein
MLLLRSAWTILFIAATVAGFVAFAAHVAVMLRNRRPRPTGLPTVDYAVRHAWLAFGCLAAAIAIGLALAIREPSDLTMRAALAYGVFGLVGFLAQMVAGMQVRLLPLLAWYTAAHRAPSPDAMPSIAALSPAPLACAAWILWMWGVPALATGFFFNAVPLLTAGALALEAAVLAGAIQALRLAGYAFDTGRVSCAHDARRRRIAARQSAVQAAEP